MKTGRWITCELALPLPGIGVRVRGAYTSDSVPKPMARLARDPMARRQMRWDSREWRGMVAIEAWWMEPAPP